MTKHMRTHAGKTIEGHKKWCIFGCLGRNNTDVIYKKPFVILVIQVCLCSRTKMYFFLLFPGAMWMM